MTGNDDRSQRRSLGDGSIFETDADPDEDISRNGSSVFGENADSPHVPAHVGFAVANARETGIARGCR